MVVSAFTPTLLVQLFWSKQNSTSRLLAPFHWKLDTLKLCAFQPTTGVKLAAVWHTTQAPPTSNVARAARGVFFMLNCVLVMAVPPPAVALKAAPVMLVFAQMLSATRSLAR